jgi:hypothetical protein
MIKPGSGGDGSFIARIGSFWGLHPIVVRDTLHGADSLGSAVSEPIETIQPSGCCSTSRAFVLGSTFIGPPQISYKPPKIHWLVDPPLPVGPFNDCLGNSQTVRITFPDLPVKGIPVS